MNKVRTVMKEFKSGSLKSSSGKKVTNPKQAIAIALSEAGKSQPKMKEGGHMKESKEMMKKEVSFMKRKGAPKSMVKHEMAEMGMKNGGMAKYAKGGAIASKMGTVKTAAPSRDGVAVKGKTKGKMVKMASGGMTKKMMSGGKC
jgi:hypothetical protein